MAGHRPAIRAGVALRLLLIGCMTVAATAGAGGGAPTAVAHPSSMPPATPVVALVPSRASVYACPVVSEACQPPPTQQTLPGPFDGSPVAASAAGQVLNLKTLHFDHVSTTDASTLTLDLSGSGSVSGMVLGLPCVSSNLQPILAAPNAAIGSVHVNTTAYSLDTKILALPLHVAVDAANPLPGWLVFLMEHAPLDATNVTTLATSMHVTTVDTPVMQITTTRCQTVGLFGYRPTLKACPAQNGMPMVTDVLHQQCRPCASLTYANYPGQGNAAGQPINPATTPTTTGLVGLCSPCPSDASTAAQVGCVPCLSGYVGNLFAGNCDPCPRGMIVDFVQCSPCPTGQVAYAANPGGCIGRSTLTCPEITSVRQGPTSGPGTAGWGVRIQGDGITQVLGAMDWYNASTKQHGTTSINLSYTAAKGTVVSWNPVATTGAGWVAVDLNMFVSATPVGGGAACGGYLVDGADLQTY